MTLMSKAANKEFLEKVQKDLIDALDPLDGEMCVAYVTVMIMTCAPMLRVMTGPDHVRLVFQSGLDRIAKEEKERP